MESQEFPSTSRILSQQNGHQNTDVAKYFKCSECSLAFVKFSSLVIHAQSHHVNGNGHKEEPKSIDSESGKKVNRLSIQIQVVETYNCPVCHQPFKRISELQKHLDFHIRKHNEGENISETPDRETENFLKQKTRSITMSAHCSSVHSTKRTSCSDNHKCPIPTCKNTYKSKDGLRKHINRGTCSRKVFKCIQCRISYEQEQDLVNHVNDIHAPKQSDKCSDVAKQTQMIQTNKLTLNVHFNNSDCVNVSGNPDSTNRESGNHNERETIACKKCDKSFPILCSRHATTGVYSTKKPLLIKIHKCTVCSRVFTRHDTLMMHINRRSCKLYPCDKCHGRYNTEEYLKYHKLCMHPPKQSSNKHSDAKEHLKKISESKTST